MSATAEGGRWKSCAQWPTGTIAGSNDISTDEHGTREQAEAVCQLLRENGFGGDHQIFPVRTWVEPLSAAIEH